MGGEEEEQVARREGKAVGMREGRAGERREGGQLALRLGAGAWRRAWRVRQPVVMVLLVVVESGGASRRTQTTI